MKRYILFLLVALSFVASTAQMLEEFHIIRSDGSFSSFLCSEIKSIQFSKTDVSGVIVSEKYVTQIVEKSDGSSYKVPISEMKEMSFDTPPIEQSTYIDLGLSVKWASCNAGASSPEGYGGYYNWKAACKFSLPTQEQIKELIDKCTWEGTSLNDVTGMKVTGPNGNSIFMPYSGFLIGSIPLGQGSNGYYWSSTLANNAVDARILAFDVGGYVFNVDVDEELSVRPVSDTPPIETYIDLGLSVKWASCNEGASSPEGYGEYYNWEPACKFNLPTQAQMEELDSKCTWEGTTLNGVKGVKVTGPNGNSIFMPCAGFRSDSTLYGQGKNGFYWSSTPSPNNDVFAFNLTFNDNGDSNVFDDYVIIELSVRTVAEK
ncbi:MAG: hypothetical protein RSA66_04910 [Muribaculaceae bacterium]